MKNLSKDGGQPMLDMIGSFLVETAVGNGSGETFSGPTAVNDVIKSGSDIEYSPTRIVVHK